jgi:hypothetical protein
MCFSHTDEDVAFTLAVYDDIFPTFKKHIEAKTVEQEILGEVLEPVFRKVKF